MDRHNRIAALTKEVEILAKGLHQYKVGASGEQTKDALEYRTITFGRLSEIMIEADKYFTSMQLALTQTGLPEWKARIEADASMEGQFRNMVKSIMDRVKIESQNIRQIMMDIASDRKLHK